MQPTSPEINPQIPDKHNDSEPNYWQDMSGEKLADYLMVHALQAEDEGRYVCQFAMLEAARRLLGLAYWPEP